MQFYPVKPVEGGGGGHLIGAAVIRRVADTYCPYRQYVELFQNCEYSLVCGNAGVLDPVSGRIEIPEGAKAVKFSVHQNTDGSSGNIVLRIHRVSQDSEHDAVLCGREGHITYVASAEIDAYSDVGVIVYFRDQSFTLSSTNILATHVAMVEFYG